MRKAYPPRRFATTTWHYLQDGVVFSITNAESIMEEHDYPGLRFTLIGTLDGLRQKVKIDISTGDAITPRAIEYRYPLMFEDRSLQIMSYNLETLLAEKLETIMYRGTSNTRMRDFYDIYMLTGKPGIAINDATLYRAFLATSNTRRTTGFIPQFAAILESVESNGEILLSYVKPGSIGAFQKYSTIPFTKNYSVNKNASLYRLIGLYREASFCQ